MNRLSSPLGSWGSLPALAASCAMPLAPTPQIIIANIAMLKAPRLNIGFSFKVN
jgi:hypothetical protein